MVIKVALHSFFSFSFMFKSRHATASAVGPIVTEISMVIGMSSVVKAPPYCQISLFSYVLNSQNPGYKFAQKIL